MEIGLIPNETIEIGENAPTVEFIEDNVDRFCEMLKTKDVYVAEPPHDEQWDGRQASFKDPTETSWELFKSIGKNTSM